MIFADTGRVGAFPARWRQCRGHDFSNEYPIHHGPEVVDVGLRCDFTATCLFRSYVTRSPLDSRLDRPNGTGLSQIDDSNTQILEDEHIGGLHVRVDETAAMHVHEPLGDLVKNMDDVAVVLRDPLIEGGCVHKLHDQ